MNQTLSSLTVAQLRQAIVIREKIEALEKQLASILGGASTATPAAAGKKRTMSPQARAKIGAAQRARWANKKVAKPAAPAAKPETKAAAKAETKTASKPKRKMTAAGRRRLSELASARWAKVRASGKSSLKAG